MSARRANGGSSSRTRPPTTANSGLPTCARRGCDQPVPTRHNRYCSRACVYAARRQGEQSGTCDRDGCDNPTPRGKAYCSKECHHSVARPRHMRKRPGRPRASKPPPRQFSGLALRDRLAERATAVASAWHAEQPEDHEPADHGFRDLREPPG